MFYQSFMMGYQGFNFVNPKFTKLKHLSSSSLTLFRFSSIKWNYPKLKSKSIPLTKLLQKATTPHHKPCFKPRMNLRRKLQIPEKKTLRVHWITNCYCFVLFSNSFYEILNTTAVFKTIYRKNGRWVSGQAFIQSTGIGF